MNRFPEGFFSYFSRINPKSALILLGFCFCTLVVVETSVWGSICSLSVPTIVAPAPEYKSYEQAIPGTGVKFQMVAIPSGTRAIAP